MLALRTHDDFTPIYFSLLFVALIWAGDCFATTGTENIGPIGTNWNSIIQPLRDAGIESIGEFNLKDFQSQARRVEWGRINGRPTLTQSGSRTSAYNLFCQFKAFVSNGLQGVNLASGAALELHEALGASCYDDKNAEVSTALQILKQLPPGSLRENLLAEYARSIFHNRFLWAAGAGTQVGGTGVSGGGDFDALSVKNLVFQHVMEEEREDQSFSREFLAAYPHIIFEPIRDSSITDVHLLYRLVLKNHSGSLTIFVPTERWKTGATERAGLIVEIARKVRELFPSYHRYGVYTFRPSACFSSNPAARATYPISEDRTVQRLQDFKAGMSLGCGSYMYGTTDVSMLVPGLSLSQVPKSSGKYYFKCEFQYHGGVLPYDVSTNVGQPMITSQTLGLNNGLTVIGEINVDGSGKLLKARVTHFTSSSEFERVETVASSDAKAISSQMIIDGQRLTYVCRKLE